MLSSDLKCDDHAVVIMDQAGWHASRVLEVPENITILMLPPYASEPSRKISLVDHADPLTGLYHGQPTTEQHIHLAERVQNMVCVESPPNHRLPALLRFGCAKPRCIEMDQIEGCTPFRRNDS